MFVRECVRGCVRACVGVCVRACVGVCVRACTCSGQKCTTKINKLKGIKITFNNNFNKEIIKRFSKTKYNCSRISNKI